MRPVGSKYLLDEVLGRGGTGTVWRGQTRDSEERVAIKILKEELANDPDVVMRFLRERSVLLRLTHPNIVRVRDLVVEGELLALVMDLVDSPDLHQYLRTHGPFSPETAAQVVAQIADALASSHADGVVHRDLKPANVLLQEEAGQAGQATLRPMLTDFGIARLADSPGVTRTSEFVGTPAYVAPESAEGRPQTSAVDIYGAGIVLYELLAGSPPFQGEGALAMLHQHLNETPQRPSGVPDPLWTVIERCLDKEPSRRPSASDLARALRTAGDGVGPHASPAAVAAAAGVAAMLVPDPSPATAHTPGEHPAGGEADNPDAQPTSVLPNNAPPAGQGGDSTAVLPPTGGGTSVLPTGGAGGPGGNGQPAQDGPHPWEGQMDAARSRNQQTERMYGQPPPPQQPQHAPAPYQAQQGPAPYQQPYQQPYPPPSPYQQPYQQAPPQQPQQPQQQRPAADSQARESRQRRPKQPMRIPGLGCMKGCLFMIVIIVVIAVLVWNFTPVPDWVAEGQNWWETLRNWWDKTSDWVGELS